MGEGSKWPPGTARTARPTASTPSSSACAAASRAGYRCAWQSSIWLAACLMRKLPAQVHELMHAFGAKHDPEERKDCTPTDVETNGRFLMSKYSNNGRKHNHEVLSPCTKVQLSSILLYSPHRSPWFSVLPLRTALVV